MDILASTQQLTNKTPTRVIKNRHTQSPNLYSKDPYRNFISIVTYPKEKKQLNHNIILKENPLSEDRGHLHTVNIKYLQSYVLLALATGNCSCTQLTVGINNSAIIMVLTCDISNCS